MSICLWTFLYKQDCCPGKGQSDKCLFHDDGMDDGDDDSDNHEVTEAILLILIRRIDTMAVGCCCQSVNFLLTFSPYFSNLVSLSVYLTLSLSFSLSCARVGVCTHAQARACTHTHTHTHTHPCALNTRACSHGQSVASVKLIVEEGKNKTSWSVFFLNLYSLWCYTPGHLHRNMVLTLL